MTLGVYFNILGVSFEFIIYQKIKWFWGSYLRFWGLILKIIIYWNNKNSKSRTVKNDKKHVISAHSIEKLETRLTVWSCQLDSSPSMSSKRKTVTFSINKKKIWKTKWLLNNQILPVSDTVEVMLADPLEHLDLLDGLVLEYHELI